MTHHEQLARDLYAAFESGNVASLEHVFAPGWVDQTLSPGRNPGRDGMKQAILQLRAALPDLQCHVEDLLVTGEKVVARLRFEGTHLGIFIGIPPTSNKVQFIAFDIHHIDGERIVESWHLEDNLALLQQIGAMPMIGSNATS